MMACFVVWSGFAEGYESDREGYLEIAVPYLKAHCFECHGTEKQKGGFRVDRDIPNDFRSHPAVEKWSEVLNMLNAGEMPPEDEPRPAAQDTRKLVEWIERERDRSGRARNDGVAVLRRMNRQEYNNTLRDLFGRNFEVVEEFPEDPSAGGFDNNGAALTLSPMQLEQYLKVARSVLDRAVVDVDSKPPALKWHVEMEEGLPGNGRQISLDDERNRNVRINGGTHPPHNGMDLIRHWGEGCALQFFTVPRAGDYIIRIRVAGRTPAEAVVRKAGVDFNLRRQEERESKLSTSAEKEESRARFEKWSLPSIKAHFAQDRRYRFGPPRLRVLGVLGGQPEILKECDVTAPLEAPETIEIRKFLEPEKSSIRLFNDYRVPGHWFMETFIRDKEFPRPELFVDWLEIEGPVFESWPPASHRSVFVSSPNKGRAETAYVRDVLADFMRRAYRRPVRREEADSKLALFEKVRPLKPSFEEAIKVPLAAVLASPHFLFLTAGEETGALNDHDLASRLSYFLWSSMPDAELFRAASAGTLGDPKSLRAQADRMLADPRSAALVENFAGQWLRLREVGANPPASNIYTRYDDHLEWSMRKESEAFFGHILKNNRSVMDLIESDYVVINERLARFYDIPGVQGDQFRVVQVPDGVSRGGLVTQAAILSVTSNGTRTSPVWRGEWILENLLGDPPPPPPPNAGDIPPAPEDQKKMTLRERMAAHREQTQCARCHDKIDPLGLALENFAATGEWRERKSQRYGISDVSNSDPLIDASARLPDGTEFEGVKGLQRELMDRQDAFLRCLARKLYTYALGRELAFSDEPVIEDAVTHMKENGTTLRSLIHHIVSSKLFRTK